MRSSARLDAFFNNAGILGPASKFVDIAPDRLQRIIAVNTIGAFIAAQEAVRRMSTRLGGKGGVIVNMSSLAAKLGGTNEATDYAASKGAIDTLTIGLAKEVATEGIRVHAVRPGLIYTDIHASTGDPNRVDRLKGLVPMQRGGTARGSGGSGAVALLRPVDLLHRPAARHLRRARPVTVMPECAKRSIRYPGSRRPAYGPGSRMRCAASGMTGIASHFRSLHRL